MVNINFLVQSSHKSLPLTYRSVLTIFLTDYILFIYRQAHLVIYTFLFKFKFYLSGTQLYTVQCVGHFLVYMFLLKLQYIEYKNKIQKIDSNFRIIYTQNLRCKLSRGVISWGVGVAVLPKSP